jgi:hypothetical protein
MRKYVVNTDGVGCAGMRLAKADLDVFYNLAAASGKAISPTSNLTAFRDPQPSRTRLTLGKHRKTQGKTMQGNAHGSLSITERSHGDRRKKSCERIKDALLIQQAYN